MKKVGFFLTSLLWLKSSFSQTALPYTNNFDTPADTVGWSHYALFGTDDWEWGVPNDFFLNVASSNPNVWATGLTTPASANSRMVLQTPSFDFSGTTNYRLGFKHQRYAIGDQGGNIEYSIDGGTSWFILNGASADKLQWYNLGSIAYLVQPGWGNPFYGSSGFLYSSHKLGFLTGQPNVKFRFKFGGSVSGSDGWVVDDFEIIADADNVIALPGNSITASKYSANVTVTTDILYPSVMATYFDNQTNYYFSYDTIYDGADILMGIKTSGITGSVPGWSQSLPMIPGLNAGTYYILFQHDYNNNLVETSETDNWNYSVLEIDSTFSLPAKFDFETGFQYWKTGGPGNLWTNGAGKRPQVDGVHRGSKATGTINETGTSYIESPYLDLTTAPSNILNYWNVTGVGSGYDLSYTIDDGVVWTNLHSGLSASVSANWEFFNHDLATISTYKNVKFRFTSFNCELDDVFIGTGNPDLETNDDKLNYFTTTAFSTDTLKYLFVNSGTISAAATQTKFYWSTDSILGGGDILLGTKTEAGISAQTSEWRTFFYTKPTTAIGTYYVFFVLDDAASVAEMRDENNTFYAVLHQRNAMPFPYTNDFETQIDEWRHNSSLGNDEWIWTQPTKPILDSSFSGDKAWITNDTGIVSPWSRMHLYSPIFDLSGAIKPVMEFNMKLDGDGNSSPMENAKINMSYSIDGGATWVVLDTTNNSYNIWYNIYEGVAGNSTKAMFDMEERSFVAYYEGNGADADRNTHFVNDISFLAGQPKVQFRFNLVTDTNFYPFDNYIEREGAIIDDFTLSEAITDLKIPYKKSLMKSSLLNQLRFFYDTKNVGNYVSNDGCVIAYHLSIDTVLDGSDLFVTQDTISHVRPDLKRRLNCIYNLPSTISSYNYLIFEIDKTNTTVENNEVNNIDYWPLSRDSINTYPYLQTFADTIVNGWNYYATETDGTHYRDTYRVGNILIPPYISYYNWDLHSQELTTQPFGSITTHISWVPIYYIETPSFDFSALTTIKMSFDLMCVSNSSFTEGGNMDYSIDGGNTWNVLLSGLGANFNWFNRTNLVDLFNEDGWSFSIPGTFATPGVAVLDSTGFDLSFLAGQSDVSFRFKYHSNKTYAEGGVEGFRIDNFLIEDVSMVSAKPMDITSNDILYTNDGIIYFADNSILNESGNYQLSIINSYGQSISGNEVTVEKGINRFSLPNELATGIYFIQFQNEEKSVVKKVFMK
jgi:hypothetical protein